MKTAAVLIVRNEARVLGRCLQSLHAAVDELLVCDTGSSDNTAEVAAAHGARVITHAWCDDFSAARNHAVAQANAPLVLSVDADERLLNSPEEARERLQAFALLDPSRSVGLVEIVNLQAGGPPALDHTARVFHSAHLRFEGAIHEQLVSRTGDALTGVETGLRIEHTGYALDADAARAKAHRNIALLRKELARHPEDEYFHYQLAKAWRSLGRHKAAAIGFQRALRCMDFDAAHPQGRLGAVGRTVLTGALCGAAYALVDCGEPTAAATLLEEHRLRDHPGVQRADFFHALGYAWLQAGELVRAEAAYRMSLGLPEDVQGTGSFATWYHLGLIAEARSDKDSAQQMYAEALRLNPGYAPAQSRLQNP